jgi:hypothetical protein
MTPKEKLQQYAERVNLMKEDVEYISGLLDEETEACALIAEAPIIGQPHSEATRAKMEAANSTAAHIRARKSQVEKRERRLK